MARIAKILPIPVTPVAGDRSISNSLAEKGFMRFPGTSVGLVPIKAPNGKYLTGLDPDADYIKRILDPKQRQTEIDKVTERKERLEGLTGLDLSPRSEYYSGVYGVKYNTNEVASKVKLIDGENTFNFNDPFREVEFWWVAQYTNLIAPSLQAKYSGKCPSSVQFYIADPDAEAEVIFNKRKASNKAIKDLETMSIDRRRKVARLLGLPIGDSDKEAMVYNELDKFIKLDTIKTGEYQGQDPVKLFNDIAALTDDSLAVKDLVRTALRLRVLTKEPRSPLIYEGGKMIAKSEDELVHDLCLDSKNDEKLALEIKVDDKKKMKQSIS